MSIRRGVFLLLLGIAMTMQLNCIADETTVPALRETLPVPVATEPTATDLDRAAGQQWHRVTLKLVGSMCPACLMTLEEKLKKMPGVTFAKVTRPDSAPAPAEGTKPKSRNASVVIIYDAAGVKFDRLLEVIKKELYRATDIKDTAI
jgi:copper chaperone CopZ